MAIASFTTSLQKPREFPVPEFRAPPPSPVTGVLTSSSSGSSGYGECLDGNDDDAISRFLHRSTRVPVLQLPERAFPRKKAAWAPAVIDMRQLVSPETHRTVVEVLKSAAVAFGCFQVVGHEVDGDLVSAAFSAAAERRRPPALEEMEGIGGGEDGEELWWSQGKGNQEMAENWTWQNGVNQFRNRADDLCIQLEQTATKILDALQQGSADAMGSPANTDRNGPLLCIHKHHGKQGINSNSTSCTISHDDILRMLIRNSRCSRALTLHLCPGASAFHIFSRRGWSRFHPVENAIVVTVGNQVQAWNGGLYKSVAGRSIYSNNDLQVGDDVISMEYFHSCSSVRSTNESLNPDAGKIIPLSLQVLVAACLVLVYHFLRSCLYATR